MGGARELLEGALYARVIWFYRHDQPADVDNLLKPILDALEGIVYGQDRTVVRCGGTRLRLTIGATFDDIVTMHAEDLPHYVRRRLVGQFARNAEDVLCVEVGPTNGLAAVFGPVDGVAP